MLKKAPKQPHTFKFRAKGIPRRYLLSGIPPGLWDKARLRAAKQGISMRALLLSLVDEWLKKTPRPPKTRTARPTFSEPVAPIAEEHREEEAS